MKEKQEATRNDQFSLLRARAEQVLDRALDRSRPDAKENLDIVFQELQVLQIELEMQNDELRSANELLEIERMRFAGIYDLAPVGYFILNHDGYVEEANLVGLKMLEIEKTGIRRERLMHFVAESHRNQFHDFYHLLLRTADKKSGQFKFISHTGREFYGQAEGRAINRSSQCYVAIVDITENNLSRLRLAEISDRMQLAMDASSAGTWELHLPSMQFYLDDRTHRICCGEPGRFNNTYSSFIDLVHPDDHFMVDQHFRTAINTGKEVDVACRFVSSGKQISFANIRGHLVDTAMTGGQRFVGIIWDVTEKKLAEGKADAMRIERQKEVTVAVLQAEEKERRRISESLHDSVSQLLYGIKLQLSEQDQADAIAKANKLLDVAIREARNIAFELAPSILTDFGLAATIDELCQRLSTPHMLIDAQISGFNARGDLFMEGIIFRIIQELVNNSMKHSGATHVQISLKKQKLIEIIVTDNGRGFEYNKFDRKTSASGLTSIRNRLTLYNGKLDISSAPGKGTTVRVQLTG
ncbi:MAG TPA: ATP-binding protein [Mucilaginibacter sp.]|nr:ATP-binding protein [Mucilaginibacter sp.]